FDTTGEIRFHVFRVTNPERLVIEMVDVVLEWGRKELNIDGNILKRIRAAQYKDKPLKIVRIVLDMATTDYEYDEISTKNEITISLGLTQQGLEKIASAGKVQKTFAKKEEVSSSRTAVKRAGSAAKGHRVIERNVIDKEHSKRIENVINDKEDREKVRQDRLHQLDIKMTRRSKKHEEKKQSGLFWENLPEDSTDFNFKEADIKEVLRSIALKLGINIIPSSSVTGKVDLYLKDVPFDDAFKMLLDRMDLVAIQQSPTVIEIVKKDEMPTRRMTFRLNSRNALEVQTTLNNLFLKSFYFLWQFSR
ncbi:AMIN domain-containing protein, partial [Elusimicrobiota bacterium]